MALSVSVLLRGALANRHTVGRSVCISSVCTRLTQEQLRGFATQKLNSTVSLPQAPKRPPSGFIMFVSDARKAVLKENPALTPTEVIKTVAGKWKAADEVTKNKYAALSRELFERYEKEKAAYASKLTEQQKQALAELTLDKKLKLTKRRLSDKLRELEKPKGARSAYVLFSTEMRKRIQEKTPKEIMTRLGAMWRQLPDEKKQLYVQQADQDRLRYDREMQAWSQRLEKEGQSDVLNDLRHDIREIRKSKQGTARKSA